MKRCEDCGCQVVDGYCVNCDESHFIRNQYIEDGEPVPDLILKEDEEIEKRKEIL